MKTIQSRHLVRLALVTVALLLIPFAAMQYTHEVNWTMSDFVIAGILIFGTGMLYLLGLALLPGRAQRYIFTIVLAITFVLTWAELAVGLFGSPWAGS